MNTKNKGLRYLLGLAVAFLLPLSFYLIAKVMSKDKIHMPHYYIPEGVEPGSVKNGTADTIYHKVGPLELTNQLGEKISTDKDLAGKMYVVDFFFINCPTICPKLTSNMTMLQSAFKRNPKLENSLDNVVQFLSITVNPARDTFQAMRAYADRYGANHDHWWFLTGDKKTIYNFARNELFVEAQPGDGGADDFIHTEKLVLVDKDRHIRGYYNGLDTADIKRCADDIVLLSMEKEKVKK